MLKPSLAFYHFVIKTVVFLTIMSAARLVFWLINLDHFSTPGIGLFLQGIRFDFVPVVYGLAPFYLVHLIPVDMIQKVIVRRLVNAYFMLVLMAFMFVNCVDMIYFKFTLKRSTWDVFRYASTGDDTLTLIPQFIADYWYMILVFAAFITLAWFLLKKGSQLQWKASSNPVARIVYTLVMAGILIVGARGGFQLKPIGIINASRYTSVQNVPLLLNTPFTLLKTVGAQRLDYKHYFKDAQEAERYFNPVVHIDSHSAPMKKNVVIIIMESLSKEYIGFYNGGQGYTPFLDSLMRHSLVFHNAYANGKKSIEALPAIFSALPNLMNEAYYKSPYSSDRVTSLALELKKYGYHSRFYHGGKNGTMDFDSYIKLAGFDGYYGKDEYPNTSDFDGGWGIYDIPYFQYFASEQENMPQPFLSSIFSLSAHHPYKLPEDFDHRLCPKGDLPIHRMICYADVALNAYFKKVSSARWYHNSIFLITADHTAQSSNPKYNNAREMYAIPIILFDPSKNQSDVIDRITQQTDITPTILDYLGLPATFIGFGSSALQSDHDGFAINYLNDIYQYIDRQYVLYFDGQKVIMAFDQINDPLGAKNLVKSNPSEIKSSENRMKSIIQSYNRRLIDNQLVLNE